MQQMSIDPGEMKNLLKQALLEVMDERKEFFHEIIAEALEDVGMINAIREGEKSSVVPKEHVLKILQAKK